MWHVGREELKATEEIESGSDRVAAIVAAALVEDAIAEIIHQRLKTGDSPSEKKARKDLLGLNSPLGSVSARITLAYLLRMLTEDAYLDMVTIAEIRNRFAHYPTISSFGDARVKPKCDKLKIVRQPRRIVADSGSSVDSRGRVRLFPTTGLMIDPNGKRKVVLSVIDHEEHLGKPRGQFLLTTQLLLAAFNIYSNPTQYRIDLSIDPVII